MKILTKYTKNEFVNIFLKNYSLKETSVMSKLTKKKKQKSNIKNYDLEFFFFVSYIAVCNTCINYLIEEAKFQIKDFTCRTQFVLLYKLTKQKSMPIK